MSKCSMDHKHGVQAWSPLATIEDIHKRLTRPPQQSSSSSITASHLFELQHEDYSQLKLNVDTTPSLKPRKVTRPPDQQSSSSVITPHLYELQHQNSSTADTPPSQKRRKLTRLRDHQSSSSVIASHMYELQHENSSQSKWKSNLGTSPLQKRRKSRAVKVRLEDYFDQSLLSSIRAKMKGSLKKQSRKMKLRSEFEEFVWPAADDHHDSEMFSESSRRRTDEAIVDLKNDDDDSLGDGQEEHHVIGVDPFQRFESTALMRFKR